MNSRGMPGRFSESKVILRFKIPHTYHFLKESGSSYILAPGQ